MGNIKKCRQFYDGILFLLCFTIIVISIVGIFTFKYIIIYKYIIKKNKQEQRILFNYNR